MPHPPAEHAKYCPSSPSFADTLDDVFKSARQTLLLEHARYVTQRQVISGGSVLELVDAFSQTQVASNWAFPLNTGVYSVAACEEKAAANGVAEPASPKRDPSTPNFENGNELAPSPFRDSTLGTTSLPNAVAPLSVDAKKDEMSLVAKGSIDASLEGYASELQSEIEQKAKETDVVNRDPSLILNQEHAAKVHRPPVRDLYHTTGFIVKVVDSTIFHTMTVAVIVANGIYIGVNADWNKANNRASYSLGFQLCEHFCVTFFVLELLLRFAVFKHKKECYRDRWFIFDLFMIILMVLEVWIVPLVHTLFLKSESWVDSTGIGGIGRLFRLLRLTKIYALGEAVPELVVMAKGIVAGLRAVHAALLILALLVYVFALIMTELVGDKMAEFGSVREGMVTLFVNGTLLDSIGELVRALIATKNVVAVIVLFVFVLLSALTVMNMLIGMLCEVVLDVSAEEKESMAKAKLSKTLLVMCQALDADGSGQLSKSEVESVIRDPEAIALLNEIQVDHQYLMDISEMFLSGNDASVEIEIFMNIVLTLRGTRTPKVSDITKAHNLTMWCLERQLRHHQALMTLHQKEILDSVSSTKVVPTPHSIRPKWCQGLEFEPGA
jgi:voltage-gated sodium channel